MIALQSVTFGYGLRKPIVQEFTLTLAPGDRVCLTGLSGRGKTTVLRLLMGLEKPRSGRVLLPPEMRISAVFQEDRLLRGRTALENVALFSNETAAEELLGKLGLQEALHQYPGQLSGGMKRRVALARALAHPFDLLVLDEPLTGLDDDTRLACLRLIDEYAAGKILVLATHNADEAAFLHAQIVAL